ncbi:MAG: hypothetical protein QN186_04905, partial [Armatimonadota bacterium]|nr:hypothetical protein [Armatimonadota bacterium]
RSGPAVFAGDDACLTVGLLVSLGAVREGRPLLVVDGANAFDPFLVADLARRGGLRPRALLDRIRLSRVFTCHQLEALLRGRLLAAASRWEAGAVYVSGPLDPLLDEEVPVGEARRIFRLIPPTVRQLQGAGYRVVIACPPPQAVPGREEFFPALCREAGWVFTVARLPDAGDPGAVRITCTAPRPAAWTWEPRIGLITPRRWW